MLHAEEKNAIFCAIPPKTFPKICGMLRKSGFNGKMLGFWVDKKREVVYNFRYKSACSVCAFCVNMPSLHGVS